MSILRSTSFLIFIIVLRVSVNEVKHFFQIFWRIDFSDAFCDFLSKRKQPCS
ncbi:hypothetical protein ALQ57_200009 [Pseudomonas amygdali pv. hibisci]|nr:hypothetical protein ALQ87_200169 [Pseudomonas savastanoi pv. glycinea]RMN54951.1 hypothetical protein ALQ57_200009 [Pseudomonas amygdali pv. hibisci]